jgi:6,7-dimethyl-8-ribityllumazine synthase
MNQTLKTTLKTTAVQLDALRVAVVSAQWHHEIVHRCRDSATNQLVRAGVGRERIVHHEVPGAFEIPLLAKRLAQTGSVDAIIGCALVVDGGIYRHDFVASTVINGLMRVQLDTDVPVFSAVLTPHHFHEHSTHQSFFAEHFDRKGEEVANALIATVSI